MRISIAQANPTVGCIAKNALKVISHIEAAKKNGANLVVFPELFLTGYPPEDLLFQEGFMASVEMAISEITEHTEGVALILGIPRQNRDVSGKSLFNSAAVIVDKKIVGYQDKILLPTYDVFDERRYFSPGRQQNIWDIFGTRIAITVCEDIWSLPEAKSNEQYSLNPLTYFQNDPPDLHINISASPYSIGKIEKRIALTKAAAAYIKAPTLLCNQVGAQDGLVFDGTSIVVSKEGKLLCRMGSFIEESSCIDIAALVPIKDTKSSTEEEVYFALTLGLKDYFAKQGFKTACLGLSGGVDSALVACIAVAALGKDNVTGCLLPSRFTSKESRDDALKLAENLKMKTIELSIENPLTTYIDSLQEKFSDSGTAFGMVEENLQARLRAVYLMAISNKTSALLLNTSNKSELAIGYSTLYGDSCGAVAVIGDLLKELVYKVAGYVNHDAEIIPKSIIDKVPTAELRPNQKDSDSIPEYVILDPVVNGYVVEQKSPEHISKELSIPLVLVKDIISKINTNEYKRRQSPFAFRITDKAFSFGRKIPIVHGFNR